MINFWTILNSLKYKPLDEKLSHEINIRNEEFSEMVNLKGKGKPRVK